jgi:hypothetical protein
MTSGKEKENAGAAWKWEGGGGANKKAAQHQDEILALLSLFTFLDVVGGSTLEE